MSERAQIEGWKAFLGWAFIGFLLPWTRALFTVGGIAILFAAVLTILMILARPPLSTLLGLPAGFGVTLVLFGAAGGTSALVVAGTALVAAGVRALPGRNALAT